MDAWMTDDIIYLAEKMQYDLPFTVHGDTCQNSLMAYPTHSHGLFYLMIPELFINHSSFGAQDNAVVINMISMAFMFKKNLLQRFYKESILELRTGVYDEFEDPIICVRKVDPSFLGVVKAYNNNLVPFTGYAQIYVKGDNHVLKDEYFYGIPS